MSIKGISVSNFRSFDKLKIEFNNVNMLIGANSSGKSNFVEIFRFLKDCAEHDIHYALSIRGGAEYVCNKNIGCSERIKFKISYCPDVRYAMPWLRIESPEVTYEFHIKYSDDGDRYKIVKDILKVECDVYDISNDKSKHLGKGRYQISHKGEKIHSEEDVEHGEGETDYFFPHKYIERQSLSADSILLGSPFYSFIPSINRYLDRILLYDIDPKLPKRAVPYTGQSILNEDGSNLAVVLNRLLKKPAKKEELMRYLSNMLPNINAIDTDMIIDKSLILKIKENYFEDYMPSSLISDGTINILATIVALFFNHSPVVFIEEPERNIHPYLVAKVMEMINAASQSKQIFVTTHNPELIKYTDIDSLLMVSRNESGTSAIYRPAKLREVKEFLKQEIGIEELFVQNMLEW